VSSIEVEGEGMEDSEEPKPLSVTWKDAEKKSRDEFWSLLLLIAVGTDGGDVFATEQSTVWASILEV
jgi:hypothetical protein